MGKKNENGECEIRGTDVARRAVCRSNRAKAGDSWFMI